VHGLELSERYNLAGGLEFQTVRTFICSGKEPKCKYNSFDYPLIKHPDIPVGDPTHVACVKGGQFSKELAAS
jgi:hypothetical protein